MKRPSPSAPAISQTKCQTTVDIVERKLKEAASVSSGGEEEEDDGFEFSSGLEIQRNTYLRLILLTQL